MFWDVLCNKHNQLSSSGVRLFGVVRVRACMSVRGDQRKCVCICVRMCVWGVSACVRVRACEVKMAWLRYRQG